MHGTTNIKFRQREVVKGDWRKLQMLFVLSEQEEWDERGM